jgi:hypothetical protein
VRLIEMSPYYRFLDFYTVANQGAEYIVVR